MRVLVVDDEVAFRENVSAIVKDGGHSVTDVASVAKAVEALEREEYDVMFTDVRMGRQSGMDLLAEARKRWPRLSVIVLTGRGTVKTAISALQQGAVDYLPKPIRPDQVKRVLELVSQQHALIDTGAQPLDPVQYARNLARSGGYEVLLISPLPAPRSLKGVSHVPLDPENPYKIRDAVETFATPRERAAVVLAAVEQLLARHREEEIAALLESIRSILQGKGPLAVGYDPSLITATGALAVRASIVSADAHSTLEALSSPIRRLVLRQLAQGPLTFTQAMEAAKMDDTSKISFHLGKLTEAGLVVHEVGERYRLTPRGKGAIQILSQIDDLDSKKGSGNRVFPSHPPSKERTVKHG
jgi:CheY-like chemotaxis protein